MIKYVREEVEKLLIKADQAHGIDHIDRVRELANRIEWNTKADIDSKVLQLTALLHDVDDYKLVGEIQEEDLPNARIVLKTFDVSPFLMSMVLDNIRAIGFSKRLKGVPFPSPEAAIVSDADLCDAMGAGGIVRTIQYMQGIGIPFFDRDKWPREHVTYEQYKEKPSETTVCHIFEKLLRLGDFIQIPAGKVEARSRIPAMEQFLRSYFKEVGAHEWDKYLTRYLAEHGMG